MAGHARLTERATRTTRRQVARWAALLLVVGVCQVVAQAGDAHHGGALDRGIGMGDVGQIKHRDAGDLNDSAVIGNGPALAILHGAPCASSLCSPIRPP